MSGDHETHADRSFSALKAAAAWNAVCVNLKVTLRGCTPAATSMFSAK